jgi:hypothetical protein
VGKQRCPLIHRLAADKSNSWIAASSDRFGVCGGKICRSDRLFRLTERSNSSRLLGGEIRQMPMEIECFTRLAVRGRQPAAKRFTMSGSGKVFRRADVRYVG